MVGKLVKRLPYSGAIILYNKHNKEYPYLMSYAYELLVPNSPSDLRAGMMVRIHYRWATHYTNREEAIKDAELEETKVIKELKEDYVEDYK